MYLCSLPASASKFIDDNHEPLFSSCSNMWPMRISGQVYNLIWNLDIGVLIIITDSRLVSKPALTENVGIGPTFNIFQISHLEFEVKRKCVTLRLIALKSEDRWQIQRKPAEIISAESFVFKIGLPISRHNFTQSSSHCLMLTKTKIIKKIAGLAHVVFIRSLLFSLFLSRSTSCDCESRMGPRVQVGLISC